MKSKESDELPLDEVKTIKPSILVSTSTFPRWKDDKIPYFIYDLCQELKNKYDVHIIAPHSKGAKKYENMDGLHVHRFVYFIPAFESLAYGGGILGNIKNNPLILLLLPLYILSGLVKFLTLIRKYRVKVVHVHWFVPFGYYAALFKRIFNYKVLLTSHGGDIYPFDKQFLFKTRIVKNIIQYSLKQADEISVVSSAIKEKIFKIYPKLQKQISINVVPMGVNTKRFMKLSMNRKDPRDIAFIGRLVEKKGVSYLIEAIKLLKNWGIDTNLRVIGDGPLLPELKKQAEDYSNIKFIGFIQNNKLTEVLKGTGLVIVPSIQASTGDREGLPVTCMEGLAMGVPVIATNTPGITDIITEGENGYIVQERSVEQIAEKIKYLINAPEVYDRLSTNALLSSKKYDWSEIGAQYSEIIGKTIDSQDKQSVLVVTSTFPRWKEDTISRFVYYLSKELSTKYNVHVLAPHFMGSEKFELDDKIKIHRFKYAPAKYEVLAYGGGTINNLVHRWQVMLLVVPYLFFQMTTMIILIRRYGIKKVHVHWILPSGFVAGIIKPFLGFKLILTSHGGDVFGLKKLKLWRLFKLENFLKLTCRSADKVTAVNSVLAKEIMEISKISNVDVIPMGIYANDYSSVAVSELNPEKLIYVGRIAEEKNPLMLVDVLNILTKTNPNITLTIVGDGPLMSKVSQKIMSLKLENNITCLGYKAHKEIPSLLRTHGIFINCSIREGLPTSFMEAMATGVPVIATETPGITDLIATGEDGYIVPQNDSITMAKRVNELINNRDTFLKLSANASIKVKKLFNWQKIGEKFAGVIN